MIDIDVSKYFIAGYREYIAYIRDLKILPLILLKNKQFVYNLILAQFYL